MAKGSDSSQSKKEEEQNVQTESSQQEGQKVTQSSDISPEAAVWVQQMSQFPITNVKGAAYTQKNRCTPEEINAVIKNKSNYDVVRSP